MPWIKMIRESGAESELKAAYDKMAELNERMVETYSEPKPEVERPVTLPELSSLHPQAMLHAREFMMDITRGPVRPDPGAEGDDRNCHVAGGQLPLLSRRPRRGPA